MKRKSNKKNGAPAAEKGLSKFWGNDLAHTWLPGLIEKLDDIVAMRAAEFYGYKGKFDAMAAESGYGAAIKEDAGRLVQSEARLKLCRQVMTEVAGSKVPASLLDARNRVVLLLDQTQRGFMHAAAQRKLRGGFTGEVDSCQVTAEAQFLLEDGPEC